jgi:RNA polymerase sigma-70 factor (ECF subfamily)
MSASDAEVDLQLVERARSGDMHAFELLVLKYRRRVERLIARMVRDVDLVEDLAQETFIRAWKALHQFRGEAQFYTWLYRIAANTAKKALLGLKNDPLVTEAALLGKDDGEEDEGTFLAAQEQREGLVAEDTPESLLAAREIADAVQKALDELPEDLRQALTLRELEGMSYEDIGKAMNSPPGTVRSRIFRAREAVSARVRPLLERQGGKRW